MERLQRREVFAPELEQTLRRAEVLQSVHAEVARVSAGEIGCRLREKHLASVSRGRDPRRPVDVDPDVALARSERLPGVQPHSDANRPAGERALCIRSRRHSVGCASEGDKERIALGVDLDPFVSQPDRTKLAVVLDENLGIPITEFLQQPCRPLDVREEKRHRPGRELGLHPSILSRRRPRD